MKTTRILITGANGFIGINLCLYLLNKKYDVHILTTNKYNYFKDEKILGKKNIHVGNITRLKRIEEVVSKVKPEYIIHLASYGNYPEHNSLSKMISVNINGLNNLLLATDSIKYKKMVITGSSSEYGFKKKAMKEDDLLVPNSFYSATKGAETLIAQSYAKIKNKPIAILRLFSVYGPYEKNSRFIPTAINAFIKNQEINLTPGKTKRDFIYIEDVVKAIEKTLFTKTNPGEIINIGSGKDSSNDEVIRTIEVIAGKKVKVNKGKFKPRKWDSSNWKSDIKKAKNILSWEPSKSLEDGLRLTYDWWKNKSY